MNPLDLLTFEWFLPKAAIGFAIGFTLRSVEHFAYHRREGSSEKRKILWLVFVGSQSFSLGVPLAYILLAVLAHNLASVTFVTVAAYMLPIFTTFLAIDLRELLRRVTHIGRP
jgi:hypothetical protein